MAGRKRREMLSSLPHNRFYLVEWEINDVIRLGGLSDAALRLWLTLKGLSWQLGQCDPTDELLADWLGGATLETVRRARRELEELHLLLTHTDRDHRWLTPLPVTRGLREKLPAAIAAQTDDAVAALRELIRRGGQADESELPPHARGVNSIRLGARAVKEEEDLSKIKKEKKILLKEGGVGGDAGAEKADAAQVLALAAYLRRMGAYAVISGELAHKLLATMSPDEARMYAHANHLEVMDSPPHAGRVRRDELVRLWVTRLRCGAPVTPEALARAAEWLKQEQAAAGASPGEEADPWARVASAPPDSVEEPEPAPPDDGARPDAEPPRREPLIHCDYRGAPRDLTAPALWEQALSQLRLQMTRDTFESCLLHTRGVGLADDGALVVEVAEEGVAVRLRVQLHKVIARTLCSIVGRELPVVFRARE